LVVLIATLSMLSTSSAWAERRYAVLIGSNDGLNDDVSLRFAERDAQRLGETLTRIGGFASEDVAVVTGQSRDAVRRALVGMNDRLRQRDEPGLLFVSYSGHADSNALHIAGERFPLDELEALVRGSAAGFRLLLVDACRSGGLTSVKGIKRAPVFALGGASSSSSAPAEGYVVFTAAAAGEDAQESERLMGSFFTHHFISGLLGAADKNGDNAITLSEAYSYTFQETVRASSATVAGTQHPTYRYDVHGKGDVVLASYAPTTGRASRVGTLRLPAGLDVLVFDRNGAVVAEAPSTSARLLRLPPGRYTTRVREARALYDGEVEVADGAVATIDVAALNKTQYARLVRKGESEAAVQFTPTVSLMGHTPWFGHGSGCVGGSVSVPVEARFVSVVPRLSACAATWDNDFLKATEREASLDVAVTHVFDLPVVSVAVGATLGALVLQQEFVTEGFAPPRTSLSPTIGALLDASVPVVGGLSWHVGVEGRSAITRMNSGSFATPLVVVWQTGLGWSI
jgi:hypothetical protein